MTFAADLEKFRQKTGQTVDELVGGVITRLAESIDRRSPVGDPEYWLYNRGDKDNPDYVNFLAYRDADGYVGGRFRGNWQLGIGKLPTDTLDTVDPDGKETLGRIIAAIPDDASGRVYYLANNLPYAQRIEHGWSRQAPTGVVGLTVLEFQQVVRDEADKLT